jgi:hypothetical protein
MLDIYHKMFLSYDDEYYRSSINRYWFVRKELSGIVNRIVAFTDDPMPLNPPSLIRQNAGLFLIDT